MLTTLPRSTHRRRVIVYGTAIALLAGWLVFEKRADGQTELAGSIENTFRGSWESMVKSNDKLLLNIQQEAEDYPNKHMLDYKNRAEEAWKLALAFEKKIEWKRLEALQTSFRMLADNDAFTQQASAGFIDTNLTSQYFKNYKSLKASQMLVQSQGLVGWTFNYCATKVSGDTDYFQAFYPAFLICRPTVLSGEIYQAEIVISVSHTRSNIAWQSWLNDQPLLIRGGVAHIRTSFPMPGSHTLHLRFRGELCYDGLVREVSRDVQVNVLEPCDSIPSR